MKTTFGYRKLFVAFLTACALFSNGAVSAENSEETAGVEAVRSADLEAVMKKIEALQRRCAKLS